MQTFVERATFRLLLPLLIPQGLWVKIRAPRFSAASGACQGSVGSGEMFNLLAIGDSIIAGVGVDRMSDALPARLAVALATDLKRRVDWVARGVSGIDATKIRRKLVPELPDSAFDCVFVSVGVNDVTGLRSTSHWKAELEGLVDDFRRHSPSALIVVSGLPPLHGFPLLPQPLRAVFGMRARTFDRLAEQLVEQMDGVIFVPNRFDPRPELFARDGYHPSSESCRSWAEQIAAAVAARIECHDGR